MNRPDFTLDRPIGAVPSEPAALLQSPLLSGVLLIILCIAGATFFEIWPETTKRFLWESVVRLTPSRLIIVMHQRLVKDKNIPELGADGGGTLQVKSAVLERIFGLDGTPLFRRTQTLTGLPLRVKSDTPAGLGNWDNSCYQNSMLQGLSSLPAFQRFVAYHLDEVGTDLPTHSALDRIMQRLNSEENNGITLWTPSALKSMSSWQQQDAQEYLSKVVAELENESSRWIKKRRIMHGLSKDGGIIKDGEKFLRKELSQPTQTAITNPLEGLLAQRVGCMRCGYAEGLSLIPFNCLTITLGASRWEYDVRDCLDDYTALEQIQDVECAKCTLLQKRSQVERLLIESEAGVHGDPEMFKTLAGARLAQIDAALFAEDFSESTLTKQCHIPAKDRVSSTKSKQVVICRPPECLVIHVNRSAYDQMTGAQYKNLRAVRFPLNLDLDKWTLGADLPNSDLETWTMDPAKSMLGSHGADTSKARRLYELRAVVTHYGRHENGHYIAYKKVSRVKCAADATDCLNDGLSSSERWFELSDADVTEISEENLLCQGGVFMLFYGAVAADVEPGQAPPASKVDEANLSMTDSVNSAALEQLVLGIDLEGPCRIPLPPTPPPEDSSIAAASTMQVNFPSDDKVPLSSHPNMTSTTPSTAVGRIFPPSSTSQLPVSPEPSETEASEPDGQDEDLVHKNIHSVHPPSPSSTRFVMRTAGEKLDLSRSHDGRSQDSFTLPASPSVVSAI